MRARARLAETLRAAGRVEEAVLEWETMLKLNPNDDQGVRHMLLTHYLAVRQPQNAQRLMAEYPRDFETSTAFAYAHVLERFLSEDVAGAAWALALARRQNPHTEVYLADFHKRPESVPDRCLPGSEDEAAYFADALRLAWKAYPAARLWLAGQSLTAR